MNTVEPQYNEIVDHNIKNGHVRMGMCPSHTWDTDPKRLGFVLARYKFVGKMLQGRTDVLEVGCGDGFGARIVKQFLGEKSNLTAIDIDSIFIEDAKENSSHLFPINFKVFNFSKPFISYRKFDAIYCLDVLEHIPQFSEEPDFLRNAADNLSDKGVFIVGTPNLQSQEYASHQSKLGHVNCKTQEQLKSCLSKFFSNVFIFSMNDEVIHTGFSGMSHYNFALCVV